MFKKRIIFPILALGCLPALTACNQKQTVTIPEIAETQIEADLLAALKNNGYSVDTIQDFSFVEEELNEEDIEICLSVFGPQNAVVHKYIINFTSNSMSQDISGKYKLMYGYMSTGWQPIQKEAITPDNWQFIAKDKVSNADIINSIKTLEFEGFEVGKVGDELLTSFEVIERSTNIEMGKDLINLKIKYNAGFATYNIGVKLQYEFSKGSWNLVNSAIDEPSYWIVDYEESQKPEEPKEEYIIGALSNSALYNTYLMNLSYVDNKYLTKNSTQSIANEITYNYVLIVKYNSFGDIEYNVSKKYIYENNQWNEGPLDVSLKSANLTPMLDTWSSSNGDFLTFTSTNGQTLEGKYTHKYDADHYVEYNVAGFLDIQMTDNNWELRLEKKGIASGSELKEVVLLPFTVDFKTDTLISNGSIFKSIGDNQYSDDSSIKDFFGQEEKDTPEETTAPIEEPIVDETNAPIENPTDTPEETTSDYNSGLSFFD